MNSQPGHGDDDGNGDRFAARPIAEGGTSSEAWLHWLDTFPVLDLAACTSLTVVAPHPDDETFGIGGAAALLRSRSVDVRLVSVTDGGGAFPGASPSERAALERDRRAELICAATSLGIDDVVRLGLPDGELSFHEEHLVELLAGLLEAQPTGSWCAATWRGDGHPDHAAVGRAAAAACQRTSVRLLEFPIWMWHWANPADEAVPWQRMFRIAVDEGAAARKTFAAQQFRTQVTSRVAGEEPILPPGIVQRLMTVGEVVFV